MIIYFQLEFLFLFKSTAAFFRNSLGNEKDKFIIDSFLNALKQAAEHSENTVALLSLGTILTKVTEGSGQEVGSFH